MLILGIDPGLQKTGWGIIDSIGSSLQFVGCGLLKTDSKAPLPNRLASLHEQLADIINIWKPETAAVEETFVNKNPASALKLGQARGVLLAVPALYGLETAEYSANKIKKSIVGTGHAAKEQMGMMIKTLLPTCGQISEDEADALAVAITHAHYGSRGHPHPLKIGKQTIKLKLTNKSKAV
ncbi:MAG: crossover junction endodeoxyribonuclease RuvC [Alphaproteobacteria bacterium]